MAAKKSKRINPPQHQSKQPGRQSKMHPEPVTIRDDYAGSGKLDGKVALVTGGDSGIGRAVAVHFAREGADVAIAYLSEDQDAEETRRLVEAEDRRCLLVKGDLKKEAHCRKVVDRVVRTLGGLDVLVNNHAMQFPVEAPEELTPAQIRTTFETNVFSYMYLCSAAADHLEDGGCIVNTGSITGTRGHETLIDYASTKGAIQSLTFSLATLLAKRGIRVNAVAGADLDAADPRQLRPEEGRDVRLHDVDGPARATGRGRAGVRLPGQRRRQLRDRADHPRQRRRAHLRLSAGRA